MALNTYTHVGSYGASTRHIYVCDVESTDRPSVGLTSGDIAICLDTQNTYITYDGSTWILQSSGITGDFFNARLNYTNSTQITLNSWGGRYVVVNGRLVDVSSGLSCAPSNNLITATGADSGSGMPASAVLYYVYVSNSAASYAPSSLRCSSTSPSLYTGVKYLATTGNGANWRFVGWVKTNATPQFVNQAGSRLVISYYNRLVLPLSQSPAVATTSGT
jgi:hypothetical protein